MIFDKIFFKMLKIKWVLMKVVGAVGAVGTMGGVGVVGVVGAVGAVGGASCTGDLWVVGVARVVGWWEFSERLGEARTCEPQGQFVGIMGSASCKDGLIKNFAKGVAGEAIKTFGKV